MSEPQIPPSPKVISATPTPSDPNASDGYFPPTTRSKATNAQRSSLKRTPVSAEDRSTPNPNPEQPYARGRNRVSQGTTARDDNMAKRPGSKPKAGTSASKSSQSLSQPHKANGNVNGSANGFLSPTSAYPSGQGKGSTYWRNLSRSPSPLGLIPIHKDWGNFVHKHEVPRKALHVSIGFITLWLYYTGTQTSQIHPVLLSLLIPIFSSDLIRFYISPAFNALYIRLLGAFMRESEAHDRFNGVISYLAGLWVTMYFCRKDVAVMSVLLLSWCDTAASTFGRWLGKYTPKVRKGKSLAGSLAAFAFGVASAILFWGMIAPAVPASFNQGVDSFAYDGRLVLPSSMREVLALSESQAQITGSLALWALAIVSGLVASVSEAIDIFGLDDNLTIPILSGAGLGAFLWAFGGS